MQAPFAVAIDGPAGSGKSTTARQVAKILGFTYIDTGAMYRTVALHNTQIGTDLHNQAAIAATLSQIDITLKGRNVYLNGQDVTAQIRTQAISDATSIIAACPAVRIFLAQKQKQIAQAGNTVMDGRDIGSHVLPWAQVKVYLDAAPEVRATRRANELAAKGQPADFGKILAEIKERDRRDTSRDHSPLIRTADAEYIDTGQLSIEETVDKIIALVNSHKNPQGGNNVL